MSSMMPGASRVVLALPPAEKPHHGWGRAQSLTGKAYDGRPLIENFGSRERYRLLPHGRAASVHEKIVS